MALRPILGRVNTIFAEQFKRLFIGPASGIRYDTPKIAEAILRLRLLGNGVPVLRLDHDVIFRGENRDIGDLGLFKAVACAVRAYQLRVAQPTVSTFLFSASYDSRALLYPTSDMDRFEAWSRAFATRIYPALKCDPHSINAICNLPKSEQDTAWNKYVKDNIDERFADQFYGLERTGGSLVCNGLNGLTSVGAHPIYAVISGALLCLSEGAILDLPPFSNFRNNVMWIDDHLKYSLHRAMYHFTSGETLNLEPGLSDARLDDVTVIKARPAISNLPDYIFGNYLPTLLWGTIMDAWITKDTILKCRFTSLSAADQERWREQRKTLGDAPLPRAMVDALSNGHFAPDPQDELREELRKVAIARIEQVRQLWSQIKHDDDKSFASYWAEGKVKGVIDQECFAASPGNRLWEGIAPGRTLDEPISRLDELSPSMLQKVTDLCEDAVTYVHWTLEWPRFVQIVRSVRQGEFVGDMSWRPRR